MKPSRSEAHSILANEENKRLRRVGWTWVGIFAVMSVVLIIIEVQ
jgi:predicted nucleic acid-binding Zn ribbon protein